MRTISKLFLTTSVALFAISLTPAGSEIHYGVLKPVSALLFIAFFISNLLPREELAQYQADQRFARTPQKEKASTLLQTPIPARA